MKTVKHEPIRFVLPDVNFCERLSEKMYLLHLNAKANIIADRLEEERYEFFKELYDFSYGVNVLEEGQRTSTRTEDVAIAIILQKERYNNRISRLRNRYSTFKRLIDEMIKADRELLVSYFEHDQKVDTGLLLDCLLRNLQIIEGFYEIVEMEKDKEAVERLKEYLEHDSLRKSLKNRE